MILQGQLVDDVHLPAGAAAPCGADVEVVAEDALEQCESCVFADGVGR